MSLSLVGLAYLVGYVLLDWMSAVGPFAPFGITPWNPNVGLSFLLVPWFNRKLVPLLFVAPLAADALVRRFPFPWRVEILLTAIAGGSYAAGLAFLARPGARFNPALKTMRDLLILMGAAAFSSTTVAVCSVATLVQAGLLSGEDAPSAAFQSWVGDMIGVAVVTPFGLIALIRSRLPRISAETFAQILAILAALVLVFVSEERYKLQLFYVLFAPIIWMAVRGGLERVTTGVLLTQLGLIVALNVWPKGEVSLAAFQAVMLVLAMTGLIAGALVVERSRAEAQLRLHQDSLARLAWLGGVGELAAALAHEINQPLTAAGTYMRLVARGLRSQGDQSGLHVETAEKAVLQLERAAAVVRRLRALVRLDQSARAPSSVERIIRQSLELSRPHLEQHNIAALVVSNFELPSIVVDPLQIEQVLLNLIRNSAEAIAAAGCGGAITLRAARSGGGFVEVAVEDDGPGFPPELWGARALPFLTSKPNGLGVGLSLCRSIVEAHGGRLRVSGGGRRGASVSFTLPIARPADG